MQFCATAAGITDKTKKVSTVTFRASFSDLPMTLRWCLLQIQGSIRPHAIIILPNSAGTEVLVCYEDEGVYIDTYGRITKDTVLQWGEMPASVGMLSFPFHDHHKDCSIVSPQVARECHAKRDVTKGWKKITIS